LQEDGEGIEAKERSESNIVVDQGQKAETMLQ
jgi:hypothetical protein